MQLSSLLISLLFRLLNLPRVLAEGSQERKNFILAEKIVFNEVKEIGKIKKLEKL